MTSRRRRFLPLAGSISLLLAPVQALDIQKNTSTADPLSTGPSWIGGIAPGPLDTALFDSTIAAQFTVPLGGDVNWNGIRVTNVGGTRNSTNVNVTVTNPSSVNTVTLGGGGIDMSGALQAFALQARLTLTADQTWNIANASTASNAATLSQNEDLAFLSQAAGTPVSLGGFTVTKVGTGTAAFSSGHTISNGTFNVNAGVLHFQGGGSRVTTILDTVNFNVASGATLRFAAQSGSGGVTTQVAAPITLNTGSTFALHLNQGNTINVTGPIHVAGDTTWTVFGGNTGNQTNFSGSLTGTGKVTYANTTTNSAGILRMSGDNSGYSGEFTIDGASGTRVLRMTGANAGSPNATWSVAAGNALEVDGVSLQLGTIAGTGTIRNSHPSNPATINVGAGVFPGTITNGPGATMGLTKIGAETVTLTGANTYTGPTMVTSGTLVVTPAQIGGGPVLVGDGAIFGVALNSLTETFATSSLTVGAGGSAILRLDTGALGVPTAPAISAPTFTPAASAAIEILGTKLSPGTFTIVDYAGTLGVPVSSLSLFLPFRVTGSLVENTVAQSLDVNITGVETPKWNGDFSNDWDIDPDNTGTVGSPNWRTAFSNTPTRYVEALFGVDSVIFDDTATSPNVNITTTVSPVGVLVNNTTSDYVFSGTGKISGTGALVKQGAGSLTIANTGANDYSGGTTISAGTLVLGDGVTPGAGLIAGPITNEGTLALNHGDSQTLANPISGSGTVIKLGAATTTLAGPLSYTGSTVVSAGTLVLNTTETLTGPVSIATGATLRLDNSVGLLSGAIVDDGTLHLNAPATLSQQISGSGGLLVEGAGTKILNGADANTYTGTTVVNAGTLSLAKNNGGAGTVAVSGDIVINGGLVTVGALGDQIADTASITVNAGQLNSANRSDTITNLTINAATPVSTFSGFNITGTLTVTAGFQHDAVNSNGTLTANTVILSNTNVRLGSNGGPSVFNIGSGGVSLTNASIVYGSAGNAAQLGIVNLNGDVTGMGSSSFDVNTGNPMSRIDLGAGTRTFNILDGTTAVEAAIVSATPTSGIVKSGSGTLVVAAGTNTNGVSTYTGDTVVNAGTLQVDGVVSGTAKVEVGSGGVLAGSGTIAPALGGNVKLMEGAALQPGLPLISGTLTINLGGGGSLDVSEAAAAPLGGAFVFDLDSTFFSDRVALTGGALNIGNGELEFTDFLFNLGFSFDTAGTYVLFDGDTAIAGSLGSATMGNLLGQDFELQFADGGNDLVLAAVPEPAAMSLLLCAMGFAGGLRRRRATAARHSS